MVKKRFTLVTLYITTKPFEIRHCVKKIILNGGKLRKFCDKHNSLTHLFTAGSPKTYSIINYLCSLVNF